MANDATGSFSPLTGYGYQAVIGDFAQGLVVGTTASAYAVYSATMDTGVGVACAMTLNTIEDAEIIASIAVAVDFSTTLSHEALMDTLIQIGFAVPVYENPSQVWVTNLDTNAISRYTNFGFTSFGEFDGQTIAVKEDGIYTVDATSDAGEQIASMVDFGRVDFGTSALKYVTNAYVGVSVDGAIVLKVIADGDTYYYTARSYDETMKTQRFDLGRGLRASFYDFELYGNGADMDVSSIEFLAIPTTRRI